MHDVNSTKKRIQKRKRNDNSKFKITKETIQLSKR